MFAAALLVPFDVGVSSPLLIAVLALFGLGLGFASPSILAAGLSAVPSHRSGAAAGFLSASRYAGSIVAAVLLSTFVSDDGSGARVLYIAAAIALILAIGAASKLSALNQAPNR
jgi:MFS transporter, DHA2 family, methylenomycin A resistance protein